MFNKSVLRLLTGFGLLATPFLATAQTVESIPFRAVLNPANEVPPIADLNASGSALVWLHIVRNASGAITEATADFQVRYTFPGPVTVVGLHIHSGIAGANGPVVIDSGLRNAGEDTAGNAGVTRQTAVLNTAAQIAAINGLLANQGDYYVNLHTTVNPGGAIRGQIFRATADVVMGQLSPANEVPPVTGLNATGTGTVMAITARNAAGVIQSGQVMFDVQYTGFAEGTNFTGLHVHVGAAGTNGPVVLDSGLRGPVAVAATGSGSLRFTNHFDAPNANAIAAMTGLASTAPGGWYINLHTQANPAGAIRGQALRTESVTFPANMTPGQEVPPITDSTATATGRFTLNTIRGANGVPSAAWATFGIFHRFGAETRVTGLHIHEAVAGQNGPVRIDSGIRSAEPLVSATGNGHLIFMNAITGGAALTAVQGMLLNPANYYLNLHTTVNPGGAVRGQLTSGATAVPTITDLGRLGADGVVIDVVAPGGVFVIDGTNLAPSSGGTFSVVDGTPQTSLNGTAVTVGGFTAMVMSVSPTRVMAVVPTQISLGPVPVRAFPVVVTTANGVSNVANLVISIQGNQ